jgi:hypothetical protein
MSRWLRWYEGTVEDGKFRVVAHNAVLRSNGLVTAVNGPVTVRDAIALWAFILEDASRNAHRGVCVRDVDFMTAILDFEDGVVDGILAAMEEQGMISASSEGIIVCHWRERQFETDRKDGTNAARQRRYRERHGPHAPNGSVTASKRSDNGPPNGVQTPETETEKEERKEQKQETSSDTQRTQTSGNGTAPAGIVEMITVTPQLKANRMTKLRAS